MKIVSREPSKNKIYVDDVDNPSYFYTGSVHDLYHEEKRVSFLERSTMNLNWINLHELYESIVFNIDFRIVGYSNYQGENFILELREKTKYWTPNSDSSINPFISPKTMMELIKDIQNGKLIFNHGYANANFTVVRHGPKYLFEYIKEKK